MTTDRPRSPGRAPDTRHEHGQEPARAGEAGCQESRRHVEVEYVRIAHPLAGQTRRAPLLPESPRGRGQRTGFVLHTQLTAPHELLSVLRNELLNAMITVGIVPSMVLLKRPEAMDLVFPLAKRALLRGAPGENAEGGGAFLAKHGPDDGEAMTVLPVSDPFAPHKAGVVDAPVLLEIPAGPSGPPTWSSSSSAPPTTPCSSPSPST